MKNSSPTDESVCTYALGEDSLLYQAIYICNTCNRNKASNECCCAGCASVCHKGHDVSFFAFGKAYCDCGASTAVSTSTNVLKHMKCKLVHPSFGVAKSLLQSWPFRPLSGPTSSNGSSSVSATSITNGINSNRNHKYQSYHISGLSPAFLSLVELQCHELVKLSKDTFWMEAPLSSLLLKSSRPFSSSFSPFSIGGDANDTQLPPSRCALEELACLILEQHFLNTLSSSVNSSEIKNAGCEWWVQVKETESETSSSSSGNSMNSSNMSDINNSSSSSTNNNNIGIDLHYDKDESIAEVFSVGIFPALSTVTYITAPNDTHSSSSSSSSQQYLPTMIFDTTACDAIGTPIHQYCVSYPQCGKHIAFDGSLLHGAPSASIFEPNAAPNVTGNDDSNVQIAIEDDINHAKCVPDNTNSSNSNSSSSSECNSRSNDESNEKTKTHYRITFLVNVWLNHQPSQVQPLPDPIRHALNAANLSNTNTVYNNQHSNITDIHFVPEKVTTISVKNQDISSSSSSSSSSSTSLFVSQPAGVTDTAACSGGEWVEYPFLTTASAWGKASDEAGVVLQCWRPTAATIINSIDNSKKPSGLQEQLQQHMLPTQNTMMILDNNSIMSHIQSFLTPSNTTAAAILPSSSTFEVVFASDCRGAYLQYQDDNDEEEEWEDDDDNEEVFCTEVTNNLTLR